MIKATPLQYGYPFPSFRTGQRESIVDIYNSKKRFVVASAPTGSGKSLTGAVLGQHKKTRALTHTRNLISQYEKIGADAIYGMSYYPCDMVAGLYADDCLYNGHMHDCPMSSQCKYLTAKAKALHSKFSVCTYAYYFISQIKNDSPDILYVDEAHFLPDLLMNEYEIVITPKLVEWVEYDMPSLRFNLPDKIVNKQMINWLERFLAAIHIKSKKIADEYNMDYVDHELVRKQKRVASLSRRITTIYNGFKSMSDMFIVFPVDEGVKVTPLSSKPFFAPYFDGKAGKVVLTSATIGNEKLFASLLGISKNDHDFVEVKHRFSPSEMPIYVPDDAPKLSYKSGINAYNKQIDIMKRLMTEHFPGRENEVSGLLHFSSKSETHKFADIMKERGFADRVFVHSEDLDTDGKAKQWEDRMKKKPNTIGLSWCFHTGLDAPQIDMNLVMKTPFPQIDEKQKAMFKVNPKYYRWKTSNTVEQAVGRSRRGEPEHYEVAGEPTRKLVAILDSNYKKVLSATSTHFRKCLV